MPKRPDDETEYDRPGGRALERLDLFEAQRLPQPADEDAEPIPELCPICGLRHRPGEEHFVQDADAAEPEEAADAPPEETQRRSANGEERKEDQ